MPEIPAFGGQLGLFTKTMYKKNKDYRKVRQIKKNEEDRCLLHKFT
jgi:hypothetical protein